VRERLWYSQSSRLPLDGGPLRFFASYRVSLRALLWGCIYQSAENGIEFLLVNPHGMKFSRWLPASHIGMGISGFENLLP